MDPNFPRSGVYVPFSPAFPPPQYMSMGTCEFFGFSISYTILTSLCVFVPTDYASFFKKDLLFIYKASKFIFRQRGRKGEKEGKKYQCVVASCAPPTGDLAHNLGMCPDWESN